MTDRYAFARDLARRAGALALDFWRRRTELVVELKGPGDFVSLADREVETLIRRELARAFPDDAFLGEETAAQFTGAIDRCWVVDPIDGTHNFLRGIPYWNVAIAFVENGRAQIGVVFDPPHDELYHAVRGGGAWCDSASESTRLAVAPTAELAGAYVALGHHDREVELRYLGVRRRMMDAGVAMRNFGAAALQLSHVAAGRLDGFVELELSIWDAIGGLALVEEAGGYAAPFAPTGRPEARITPPPGAAQRRQPQARGDLFAPRASAKAACLACAPGIADALAALTGVGR